MKIEITGEPKEIAALVLEIQERQGSEVRIDGERLVSAVGKSAVHQSIRGITIQFNSDQENKNDG